jgi:predicted RNA-binding protein with TRAM domain
MANKDRYGKRHRQDSAHDVGDSAPGTVGDSDGTFHDRARQDSRVIVDGQVQSVDESAESGPEQSNTSSNSSSAQSQSHSPQRQKLNEQAEVTVDRVSNSGNPIAKHQGDHVHVPGGNPGETYRVELYSEGSHLVGEPIKVTE